jgi:hypothetical protein
MPPPAIGSTPARQRNAHDIRTMEEIMTDTPDLWPGDFYRMRETLSAEIDQAIKLEIELRESNPGGISTNPEWRPGRRFA